MSERRSASIHDPNLPSRRDEDDLSLTPSALQAEAEALLGAELATLQTIGPHSTEWVLREDYDALRSCLRRYVEGER